MQKIKNLMIVSILIVSMTTSMLSSIMITNAATSDIPTAAYVVTVPNVIGAGQTLTVSGWVTPPPDISWNYAGYYFDITNPDGTKTTKGPYNSFPDGTTFFTLTPTVKGTYSIIMRWEGGNNTVNYTGVPTPPKVPYQPATSEPYTFIVQQEPVQVGAKNVPLPTEYWSRPISSEFRSWSNISGGGDWIYTGGFGDYWRPDGLGNNQVNPYSAGPNSAHVLWVKKSAPGGLVGGPSGAINNPGFPMIDIVISGVGYYQLNGLHAIDIYTGQELWVNTAMTDSPSFGQPASLLYTPNVGSSVSPPYLWVVSDAAIKRFNAATGAQVNNYPVTSFIDYAGVNRTITNLRPQADVSQPNGGVLIYVDGQNAAGSRTGSTLMCWNSTKPGTTFASKIQWTAPGIQVETRPFLYLYKDVIITAMQGQAGASNMSAYNSQTGQSLWNTSFPYEQEGNAGIGYGKLYMSSGTNRMWHAYDVYTGREVWASPPGEFPFGAFWAYSTAVTYDKVFAESYDGNLYAFNAADGSIAWKFYSGNTTETPFNTWPFYARMVVADGKIYAGTTEHSPTPPYTTGNRIYAVDTTTGQLLWSMAGQYQSKSIADGVLIAGDDYTGQLLAWGKGPSATTVSVQSDTITYGNKVMIKGMVTDESAGTQTLSARFPKGVPAVSNDSMTPWMEYLYMQKPQPTNTTGVEVNFYVLDANDNFRPIGKTVSNADGFYSFDWKPDIEGKYTVYAQFAGSESYWPSQDLTAFDVAPSQSTAQSTTQPTSATEMYFVPAVAGIIVTIIIVGVVLALLLLRKRP